ncbi:MAG: DUF2634 domain-containing protein [Proteobacteria bacterium]|nr:DUF2634 domain-containing protein [Pseudomonadota bacterium]
MIPKLNNNLDIRIEPYKSKTYRLDFANKRIVGMIDGLDASVQAVQKIVQTERYSERIYSGDYGIELERLIGASMPFVEANMEPTIKEALSPDDRFVSVRDISLNRISIDTLAVSCHVATTSGEISARFGIGG